ncbi:MAG: cytochrome c-type biogenesis protein CcmH [Anaerolineae bacterium]|jgi:cytochrome c-type biogenesis protein CcmH|nr:cytochrome c-type biogenesis protein CcmH [Anaerolineae bacterium]
MTRSLLTLALLLLCLLPARAQRLVTQDDITLIAEKLYCPVCENIPLDDCGMPACLEWKDEIGRALAAGQSEDQIIAGFVARYGEQVVGVPQQPGLRALALVTPWLLVLLVSAGGWLTFRRWRRATPGPAPLPAVTGTAGEAEDYRQRLERDV